MPETLVSIRPAPLSPAEVVAVARDGAAVALSAEAEHELEVGRKVVEALAARHGAALRHLHRLRRAGHPAHPAAQRAQLQRSLIRSHAAGTGPEVEREVVRALMLLRLSTLATGRTGVRRETAPRLRRAAQRRASRRSCPSTARSAAPATSRRSPHCALALMGEGDGARRRRACCCPAAEALAAAGIDAGRAGREGGPRADQRHRRHARHAGAGRCTTCAGCCARADVAAAMSVEALLGTDARVRRRPAGAAAAARAGASARPTCAPLLAGLGDHGQPPRPGVHPGAGRLLAALRAAGARRRPRHRRRTPRRSPAASWPPPSTTRWSLPDGRVESNGNFHGAPVGYVLDFLAIAVADVAVDQRAAHRPVPRRGPHRTGCRRSWPTTPASTPAT